MLADVLYMEGDEVDLHHLLIHCPRIWELLVCPLLTRDLITGWKAIPVKRTDKKVSQAAPGNLEGEE